MCKNRPKIHLNLGALNCHGLKEKFDLPEMIDLITSCDIFGVNETWLTDNDDEVDIPGFSFYSLNRKIKKAQLGAV